VTLTPTPSSASEQARGDSWLTRTLLSFLGPADSEPMGPDGHVRSQCLLVPAVRGPFSEHSYDRTDADSRICCPVN